MSEEKAQYGVKMVHLHRFRVITNDRTLVRWCEDCGATYSLLVTSSGSCWVPIPTADEDEQQPPPVSDERQLITELHEALDEVLSMFVAAQGPGYSCVDLAVRALAKSRDRYGLPVTIVNAQEAELYARKQRMQRDLASAGDRRDWDEVEHLEQQMEE